jgi:nitrogen regulatory protein P-II 1
LKKIEAIVRTEKLNEVKTALALKGHIGLTVYGVMGRGRQKGIVLQWRGVKEYRVDLLPKTKLEIAVDDDDVEEVVTTIIEKAFTGQAGDGKIFVMPLDTVIRIRTGERGKDAV